MAEDVLTPVCEKCGKEIGFDQPRVAAVTTRPGRPPSTKEFHLDCAPKELR